MKPGAYDFDTTSIFFYNATSQNNCKIELYIATVSIKHKGVDGIKTALRFWFNAR